MKRCLRTLLTLFLFCSFSGFTMVVLGHGDGKNAYNNFTFIPNANQWHPNVVYRADITSGTLFLERNGLKFDFYDGGKIRSLHASNVAEDEDFLIQHHMYEINFLNTNSDFTFTRSEPTKGIYNFYSGNDQNKWATGLHGYHNVRYNNIYQNIDYSIYTSEGYLKYDFIVHPGGNPKDIKLEYDGLDEFSMDANGDLILVTTVNKIVEKKPYAYQEINGKVIQVACEYKVRGKKVSYSFPNGYDKTHTLIIDPPLLIFSTYSGSTADNFGYTATFDKYGFLYAGGSVFNNGYPLENAYQTIHAGGDGLGNGIDWGVTKYDTTGEALVYSTLFGGSSDELPHSFVVNDDDELYVFGTTSSSDFPIMGGAYTAFLGGPSLNLLGGLGCMYPNGTDIVVVKFDANGQLDASTFLGGTDNDGMNTISANLNNGGPTRYNYADEVRGEVMVEGNNIYVATCTRSADIPIIGNTFQQNHGGAVLDGIIFKLNSSLSSVLWSSYLGADGQDAIYSLAIDGNKDIYVAGGTSSTTFPVSDSSVVDTIFSGVDCEGFVTHVSSDGSTILESTYWGSDVYDQIYFVELDRYDNVYVYGQTHNYDSTFIINAQYSSYLSGQFISKFTPQLDSVIWSTKFGSGASCVNISPTAFLVDLCNKIYLSGWGGTTNNLGFLQAYNDVCPAGVSSMDTKDCLQCTTTGSDFYIFVMEDDASDVVFADFFGGPVSAEHVDGGTSRFDRKGKIYQSMCAGCGSNSDMTTETNCVTCTNTPWSSTNNSPNCNNGVFKMDFLLPLVVADFIFPPVICESSATINFINNSQGQGNSVFWWDFGDGNNSTLENPTHTYNNSGTYTITMVISDTGTCNLSDTAVGFLTIIKDSTYFLADINICPGDTIDIGPVYVDTVTYSWTPTTNIIYPDSSNPLVYPPSSTTYICLVDNGICVDTVIQNVNVSNVQVIADNDTVICSDDLPMMIDATSATGVLWYWSSNNGFTDTLNPIFTQSQFLVPDTLSQAQNWFYIMTVDQYGCEAIDSILIELSDLSVQVEPDLWICVGDSIWLEAFTTVQNDTLTFLWGPANNILSAIDSSAVLVSPQSSTQYFITVTTSIGCTRVDTVNVWVSQLSGDLINAYASPDTIFKGGSSHLFAEPNGYNYQWLPITGLDNPNSSNPIASPDSTTTYIVTITDPYNPNCTFTDTVTIYVIEIECGPPNIYIPNAFTPNDDGRNDLLLVRGRYIYEMYFAVYDRWGEKVFETKDQDIGWDGYYKGRKVDPAVFVYYLEAGCIDKQEYFEKGNVTVIR